MRRKVIYLLLALILPVSVFIFLRSFGKNEFSIPVYYELGIEDKEPGCAYAYSVPYRVSDSIMLQMGRTNNNTVTLLVVDTSSIVKVGLNRMLGEFDPTDFQLLFPSTDSGALDHWYACFFFLHKPWSAVLIDSENRIRGYYSPNTREEVDRMIVEMKILLEKY
jgi:hypothetical protein